MDIERIENETTPVGTIVLMTAGCYSDYSTYGLVRVVKEVNFRDEQVRFTKAFYASEPDKELWYYGGLEDEFFKHMLDAGYVEPVECKELHMVGSGSEWAAFLEKESQ